MKSLLFKKIFMKHLKTFEQLFENKETNLIGLIIKYLIKKYEKNGIPEKYINSGSCPEFAEDLCSYLEDEGIESEVLSDGMFYDPFEDEQPEIMCDPNEYGSLPPKDFDKIGLPSHYWVYCDGKHYDSEAPNGVENFFDLPTIKNFYEKHRKHH